jgi:glucose/arabinose dehydrogenase
MRFVFAVTLLAGLLAPARIAGQQSGFTESQLVGGLSSPTAMAFAPDGRLFVAEQGGQLRVIKSGALLSSPFLTVTVDPSGERGLLGVAFDPQFSTNGFVYIYYTATTPAVHNRVSRFTASGDGVIPGSEVVLLDLENLSVATNHNGGALHFGPDGKLYVAVGENALPSNSQTLANRLGKILRVNPDGSIPPDNPFFNVATGLSRSIWTLGLRNPFTFAFQPGTGRLFINDVGAAAWEEINEGIAGSNYGWPATEGYTTDPNYRSPLFAYGHGSGPTLGCAIAGGAFYNPATSQFPAQYAGSYFFADFCSGWIRRLDPANGNAVSGFWTGIASPVDLRVGPDGSLYVLARGSGSVRKIEYSANQPPSITAQPAHQVVSAGQPATFSVSASGSPPLAYQWQRNGANIPGATAPSYTLPSASPTDDGAQFRAVVTNSFGSATSNVATLTVVSNSAPTGTIVAPAAGALYRAGDTIGYSGTGSDPEDGSLPPGAFTWRVDFHHDTHLHPFIPSTTGAQSGSFTIPTTGETSANVWYRLHLTVRDANGATHSSYRDILPRTSTITLATSPSGLGVTLDGQPLTAPSSMVGVVGMNRTLGAPGPQTLNGVLYEFDSWSDGGSATHVVVTPDGNATFTAAYRLADSDGDGIPDAIEAQEGTNPGVKDNDVFGNARLFAMQQYRDFLWREGDSGGITYWTNAISSGGASHSQVIESFFNSSEFQNAFAPITRLYFAYLLRIPDYAGLLYWQNRFQAGITLRAISTAFAAAPEFQNTYGGLTNSQFVDLVYQNVLGRAPDPAGRTYWLGQLNAGLSRGDMVLQFSQSTEYQARSRNWVYVTQIYVGMLRRAPDQAGFDFWVAHLDAGNSGLSLIQSLFTSSEYHDRFLP